MNQFISVLRQFAAFMNPDGRRLLRQRLRRFFQRGANILHKGDAPLLIFLIQTLGLFEFFVHHHFSILVANNQDLRARSHLAAVLADFIKFIIDRRLNHPLMLIGHIGDVLQVEVRQQMIGNRVTNNGAVGFLIVHQQAQR